MTLVLSLFLGMYVYMDDKNNKVNKIFVLMLLSAFLWIFCNFMTDISSNIFYIDLWSKATIIGPIFIGYFFYRLSFIFPRETKLNKLHLSIVHLIISIFLVLTFTKINISGVYLLDNGIPAIEPGPLYLFFLVYFVFIVYLSSKNLFNGYHTFFRLEKLQVKFISIGLGISIISGVITNLILPILYDSSLVNFGPYFILIFTFFTSYAVIRFKMFNIKIITAQLLVFSLWTFILLRILLTNDIQERIINSSLLILLIIFGILLIKSVIKEVAQRENIEKLAVDLQKANDKLKDLDKQKSEFVSFATHQLRAPLTAMKGYASLILEGDLGALSQEIRSAISRIYDSSDTLTHIVDDYLNISRIELGAMKYTFENVNLIELIDNVIAELKPNIEKSKTTLSFIVDRNKKFVFRADKDKFKQIIANIIDNSVKYTPIGNVVVKLEKTNDMNILLSIKDNGIGIAPEVIPKLFAKFSRADNANKKNIHGTGLGLFVAKEIVSAHKGKIWAESEGEGKGSTFFVELEGGE